MRFRVWAPRARSVALCLVQDGQERRLALAPTAPEPAVYEAVVPALAPGSRYGYSLDGAAPLPDPVSRHQPDGVHGLSAVVAADAYRWSDGDW
ncbi:MAG: malto-oligosyltrehalose trehalohydrolase, partial [Gammaproteobacteria bacterium]|nr:malto-oligosyltrehalose trehalohydrolase [Gammaproteobacteria bacterium]